MSDQFKAIVINQSNDKFSREIKTLDKSFFKTGNVLVKVQYSGLNYKDALILKNGAKLVKEYPHIPGIDFSGQVVDSEVEDFKSGNSSLDSNSYRVLEALKYPNIIFKSLNIEEVDGMLNIVGLIEFHGIERSIDVMVISTNIENTTKLFGEFTINLSDYSVDRPSLLLRKIDNQITIVFELVFS